MECSGFQKFSGDDFLCESVDIVRIFYIGEQSDDVRRRKSHPYPQPGHSPCLGESLQDDKVRVFVNVPEETALR